MSEGAKEQRHLEKTAKKETGLRGVPEAACDQETKKPFLLETGGRAGVWKPTEKGRKVLLEMSPGTKQVAVACLSLLSLRFCQQKFYPEAPRALALCPAGAGTGAWWSREQSGLTHCRRAVGGREQWAGAPQLSTASTHGPTGNRAQRGHPRKNPTLPT